MTLKQYLSTLAVGTAFAWIAWFLILTSIDPAETSAIGIFFFYLTLFAANAGLFTIIGTLIRQKGKKERQLQHIILTSLRQAILLSLLVGLALFLSHMGLLRWWVMLATITLLALVEFFALSTASHLGK